MNVQGSIKPQGSSDGGYNLTYQPMQFSRGEPRTSSPTKAVENLEALKTCALDIQFLNLVQDEVNDFVHGVVTMVMFIGSIFFACDELLRVEVLVAGAIENFINECGFQVCQHCPGYMLASACFTEEVIEGVVSSHNGLVIWHLDIRLDSVFQAVEFPTGIADLDGSLANVDGDALRHSFFLAAAEQMVERKKRGCCFL
ncbi:hypothetical protein CB1_001007007 [Camelus ferus]|nr:hypothetical protein CB1_001007007 [Camelus ferus]